MRHLFTLILASGLTFTAMAQTPIFSAGSVVNGASLRSEPIAPRELVSIFGTNLGPASPIVAGAPPLPTVLGGFSVLVNGVAAPLFFVSASEINFEVPVDLSGTTATLQVTGMVNGLPVQSAIVSIPAAATAPGLFTLSNAGIGLGVFLNSGYTVTATNPAHPGDALELVATGFGATNPAGTSGSAPPANAQILAPVSMTVDGQTVSGVYVPYPAPALDEFAFTVPASTTPGLLTVVVEAGSQTSNSVLLPIAGAGSTTLYQTGFEPPSYALGPIDGQTGWGAIGTAAATTVENTITGIGAQAVAVTMTGASGLFGAGLSNSFDALNTSTKVVVLSVDADLGGGNPSWWTLLHASFNDATPSGHVEFNIDTSGQINIYDGFNGHPTGVYVTRGGWNHYELALDFSTRTVTASYNGTQVYSGSPFGGTGHVVANPAFYAQLGGTDVGYFDNFSESVGAPLGGYAGISVSPNLGLNTGSVAVTLSGDTILNGAQVKLSAIGLPDILGTNESNPGPSILDAQFSLGGAAPGARDVVVSNGSSTVTLPSAFTVLAAPSCSYSIAPASQSFAVGGGSGSFIVTASSSQCSWSASAGASWITLNAALLPLICTPSGCAQNPVVSYSVAANPSSAQRTGTISVSGATFTVTQAGTATCAYAISPTSQAFASAGGPGTVNVTAPAGCPWTAASNVSWVNVPPGSSSGCRERVGSILCCGELWRGSVRHVDRRRHDVHCQPGECCSGRLWCH